MSWRLASTVHKVGSAAILGLFAFLLAAGGGARSAARPAGSTSDSTIPAGLVQAAAAANVSNVKRVGPAGPNDLGFFSGSDQSGQAVVALASDDMVESFVPQQHLADYLAGNKLYVFTADAGGPGSVNRRDVLGEVAPKVARVAIDMKGGGARQVPIVDQTFVYTSTNPSTFASAVVAYNAAGRVLATNELGRATAPVPRAGA